MPLNGLYTLLFRQCLLRKIKRSKYLKFLPTPQIYGSENYNESQVYKRRKMAEHIKAVPQTEALIPKSIYPDSNPIKEINNAQFDPTKSALFADDGREVSEFHTIEWIQ